MKKIFLTGICGLILATILVGCRNGESKKDTTDKIRSSKVVSRKKKNSKPVSDSSTEQEKKESKVNSQSSSSMKSEKYALPKGPEWVHVYVNDKKTSTNLLPDKNVVKELKAEDSVSFGGVLPWINEVKLDEGDSRLVSDISTPATIDESEEFDRKFMPINLTHDGTLDTDLVKIEGADNKQISQQIFKDLPIYLEALSTNDKEKLPNQSEGLRNSLDTNNVRGKPEDYYELQEIYYNKKTSTTNDDEYGKKITIGEGQKMGTNNVTTLEIPVFAKVKKTPGASKIVGDDPEYKKTKTKIQNFNMRYVLDTNNEWQLDDVEPGEESEYAMNTTGKNWITKNIE